MKAQAYFEKINKQIEFRLQNSKSSIRLAVAWFTDAYLFHILCEKANAGQEVELIIANHEINHESSIVFNNLTERGGKIYWIGKGYNFEKLMHNKVCIIDNSILITGSYNWTRKAKSNHENILIIEDEFNLILDFNHEFDRIINKYYKKEIKQIEEFDWDEIIIQLETLSNVIKLKEEQDIKDQINKIKNFLPKNNIDTNIKFLLNIVEHCQKKSYSVAVNLIDNYTNKIRQLVIFNDPEILNIKLEVRVLEYQIACLEGEKTEVEKLINRYKTDYNLHLGELIKNILFLKKELAKQELNDTKEKQSEFEEADKNFDNFSKAFEDNLKKPKPQDLDKDQLKELKQNFRKATKFCHPDKVTEEQKEQAEKIFNELKCAYDANNLDKVNLLLKRLEKGIFKSQGETITEKEKLKSIRESLKIKEIKLSKELAEITKSLTYCEIKKISNWQEYFENMRFEFGNILKNFNNKINIYGK